MKILSFAEMYPAQVIFLSDKRPLLIDELVQYNTYRGLLVGFPDDRSNDRIPRETAKNAKSRFGAAAEPFVIPAKLHSFSLPQHPHVRRPGGDFEPTGEAFTRIGRRLPKVTCISSLRCPIPLVEPKEEGWFRHWSATIVWFQEEFAFPIDAEVMAQIRALDWSAVAVDGSD